MPRCPSQTSRVRNPSFASLRTGFRQAQGDSASPAPRLPVSPAPRLPGSPVPRFALPHPLAPSAGPQPIPVTASSAATAKLVSDSTCHGQYSATGTPNVATMKTAVACQGTRLSSIVPVSSSERDSTRRGIDSASKRLLNASPTIKLVAYWLEVVALVSAVAASVARMDGPSIDPSMLLPLLLMAGAFKLYFLYLLIVRMRGELTARRIRLLRLSDIS